MMLEGVMPQLGKDSVFTALGQQWTLSRREMDVWDDLYQWARQRLGDPFQGLDMLAEKAGVCPALLPLFEQKFAEAQEKAASFGSMNCPEILKIIDGTSEGIIHRLWLLFRIKHPDINKTTVALILEEVGQASMEAMVAKADGRVEVPVGNCQALAVSA